ncbi:hypothetical protein [Thiomicrorhabdus sp. Kp2]|uniref:hypothetical protein n=1 Tax=Thiomicrorhabdus sp. Kp2 TaxID=1123518 RepID=UPI000404B9FA|nr:hypothetical protein [Thiomicrorhabdus sp. Kp2]
MSEIDLEKDDKATQEMLSMMGNITPEMSDSLEDFDADDLLNALDELPSIEADQDETQDVYSSKETDDNDDTETDSLADLGIDLDDLDSLMAEAASEVETEVEVKEPPQEMSSAGDDIDLDSLDLDDLEGLDDIDNLDDLSQSEAETALEVDSEGSEVNLDDIDLNEFTEDAGTPNENSDEVTAEMDNIDLDNLDLDDLDNLADTTSETGSETTEPDDGNNDMPDLDDIDLEALDNAEEELPIDQAGIEDTDIEDDVEHISETSETENSHLEMVMENQDTNQMHATEEISNDDLSLIDQASQSVSAMEEAIGLDQSIQNIAQEVKTTAQEATQLALATSKEAQASAEKTQQAIEATFAAAERAFEAAKKAGYTVDLTQLNSNQNTEEVAAQLAEIQEKNTHLKSVNESIRARIAEMKAE